MTQSNWCNLENLADTSKKQTVEQIQCRFKIHIYGPKLKGRLVSRSLTLAFLFLLTLQINQSQNQLLIEAKTHHSKRQVNSQTQNVATGRENTNWWNLWWQQYIDEAIQPTIRPITAVHFNGKSIKLSEDNYNRESQDNRQSELENNFVLNSNLPSLPNDLARDSNGLLPNSMHPSLAAKQRKSVQQQANWQMVGPTIIQPQPVRSNNQRDLRTNRQANMFQANELDTNNVNMGIQMRANPNRQQQQQQQQRQQINNDYKQMLMEFEQQQQNQMIDYAEENDLPLDNSINSDGQTNNDSSSSSMMMSLNPVSKTPDTNREVKRPVPPLNQKVSDVISSTMLPASQQTVDDRQRTSLTGRGMQTKIDRPSTSVFQSTTPKQQNFQTNPAPSIMNLPQRPSVEMTTTTTQSSIMLDSQTTSTSTGPAQTSSSSGPKTSVTPAQNSEVDVNETPISIDLNEQNQSSKLEMNKTPSMMSTTPSGRVELMNGRPATGMSQQRNQQQATTTSSRLPTLAGQTRPVSKSTTPGMNIDNNTQSVITSTTSSPLRTSSGQTGPISSTTSTTISNQDTAVDKQPEGTQSSSPQTTPLTRMTNPSSTRPSTTTTTTTTTINTTQVNLVDATTMTPVNSSEGGNRTDESNTSKSNTEDDEEGEEEVGEGNMLKNNAESVDENNDEEEEDDRTEPTTTSLPNSDSQTSMTTTQKSNSVEPTTTTTQQPTSLEMMDIERVNSKFKQTSGNQMNVEQKPPQLVMMTLTPSDRESGNDAAITLPMDTLMKMVMNQVSMEEATTSGESPKIKGDGGRASDRLTETEPTQSTGNVMQTTVQSKNSKLQPPPPTTKMPTMMSSTVKQTTQPQSQSPSQSQSQTIRTSDQSKPVEVDLMVSSTPKTINIDLNQPEASQTNNSIKMTVSSAREDEPKIDMLNLDLVPIKRLMNGQQEREEGGKKMVLMMQSPVIPTSSVDQTTVSKRPQGIMEEQLMSIEQVEPGMRLRPANSNQQQQPGKDRQGNQASTVYMIMMNNGQQQPVLITATNATAPHSKKPIQSSTEQRLGNLMTSTANMEAKQTTTGLSMGTTVTGTREPMRTTVSMPTTTTTTTTTTNKQIVTVSQPTTKTNGGQIKTKQPKMTTTMPSGMSSISSSSSIISNPRKEEFARVMNQTSTSRRNNTRPSLNPMQMMMERQRQQITSNTQQQSQTTTTSPPETTTQQMETTSQSSTSLEGSSSTSSSIVKTESNFEGSKQATNSNPTSTSNMATNFNQNEKDATVSTTVATPTTESPTLSPINTSTRIPSTSSVDSKSSEQQAETSTTASRQQTMPVGENQFERLQQPGTSTQTKGNKSPQEGGQRSKTSKVGKTSGATFIPSKLRMDFNRTSSSGSLEQQPTMNLNGEAQQQQKAIRQFGGANRMSAIANQPVPFGRPAAMTMQSQQQRFEVPTFEYGPSISVRRPDEPLANGQMPNCTLAGKNFCVLTKDYPMNEVRQAVERSFRSVRIMYEELQTVSDQELHKDDFNATNNQAASGKFACQTQVEMMRPGWAKDEITKEWMLVVNTDVFPQRVRTESCAQPNTPCEFIAPFYDSTCQQRYSLHRMIAIDPHDPSRSPQVAVFKFPAGCVCRVHPIKKSVFSATSSAM